MDKLSTVKFALFKQKKDKQLNGFFKKNAVKLKANFYYLKNQSYFKIIMPQNLRKFSRIDAL